MTLYRATLNGPLPGTLADSMTICICKAWTAGYLVFEVEQATVQMLKQELEAK